jgi:hypothetical protein
LARAYGIAPEIAWHWPLTWWIKVRDEYFDSLKPVKEEDEED